MLPLRKATRNGLHSVKTREWNSRSLLAEWRVSWQTHVNRALERAGRKERVDHRTLFAQHADAKARGDRAAAAVLDRAPEIHVGPRPRAMQGGMSSPSARRGRRAHAATSDRRSSSGMPRRNARATRLSGASAPTVVMRSARCSPPSASSAPRSGGRGGVSGRNDSGSAPSGARNGKPASTPSKSGGRSENGPSSWSRPTRRSHACAHTPKPTGDRACHGCGGSWPATTPS